jgi:hypothetical protein
MSPQMCRHSKTLARLETRLGNTKARASIYTADEITMGPSQSALTGKDAILASSKKDSDQIRDKNRCVVEDARVS